MSHPALRHALLLAFVLLPAACARDATLEVRNTAVREVTGLVLVAETGGRVHETPLEKLPPGTSTRHRVRLHGEGGVKVRFILDGRASECDELYVESGYRTRMVIGPDGRCRSEVLDLGVF